MSNKFVRHGSIAQMHEYLGFDPPLHPLITVVDTALLAHAESEIGTKIAANMYCIALKDPNCGLDYGRNHYDFEAGALVFTAPGQVITLTKAQELGEVQGWLLYFDPDLIRNTSLGARIDDYTFFSYDVHEALHLSEQEKATMGACVDMILAEISERIDDHSHSVLVSQIELMLNYSTRFYARQFNTRTAHNSDVVSMVERLLKEYYQAGKLLELGHPSIQLLAEACHVSPGYLSDLLKKETGRTAKDHINDFLIDKAKHLLLSSSDSISGIGYALGFNYPHYFSRLFKRQTGMTPQAYRASN